MVMHVQTKYDNWNFSSAKIIVIIIIIIIASVDICSPPLATRERVQNMEPQTVDTRLDG